MNRRLLTTFFFIFVHQLYPLWICPFKLAAEPGMVHPPGNREEMYVDIGAYGTPKAKGFSTVPSTRKLEDFVAKVKGLSLFVLISAYTFFGNRISIPI